MNEPFKYDVFMSYSAHDQGEARALAERLRRDGLRVWPLLGHAFAIAGKAGQIFRPTSKSELARIGALTARSNSKTTRAKPAGGAFSCPRRSTNI